MSNATKSLTDKFKCSFIRVSNVAESVEAQKAMFQMGFTLARDAGRKVDESPDIRFIYVNIHCRMFLYRERAVGNSWREVDRFELRSHAEAVRMTKRKEGSAQKKRAAVRKWDATATKRTLETCPVRPRHRTIVAVKLTDGTVISGIASTFRWTTVEGMNNIESYKVTGITKPKRQAAIVSQEIMAEAIAADIGKGLAVPVDVKQGERIIPAADTNPKKQYGLASIPLNMWSPLASAYGALGLYNGSLKYGSANFANTKVEASIYIAAAMRHLSAWAAGEEFDPADGVPNLGGVLANIAILLEARAAGTLIDDRLLMSGYLKERDTLKAIVPALQAVHAGKTPKHYTLEG